MQFSPLLLICLGIAGVIAGRLLFDRWFNHVSLYSFIWGTGLAFFEMRLIDYKSITAEVWMVIAYAWMAFVIGAATLRLAKTSVAVQTETRATVLPARNMALEHKLLVSFILILSAIAMLAVLRRWSTLINMFGGIGGVLVNGITIYRMRVSGETAGTIPYLPSLALTAVCLAGMYSGRVGKIKLLVLIPLFIIIIDDISHAGRAKMLIGGILFFTSYSLTRFVTAKEAPLPISKVRGVLTLGIVVALLFVAAEFVRSYRGAYERFYGASKELSKLERNAFVTPSIYLYLSSQPGVFNAYWKAGGEHYFPGANTFAPLFRILARLNLSDSVPHFQKFYSIPVQTNTGTYLRELHADFGIAGILVVPYVLGFLCTMLWFRVKNQPTLAAIALLTHLYVIVAFSYLYQVTRVGEWFVSLIASLLVSYFINLRLTTIKP